MLPRGRFLCCALLLVVAWIVDPFSASAGKFNRVLSVGDSAPAWKDLIGTDDKRHSLADCKQPVIVVVFLANHCPVAAAYEERLRQLATDYRDRGVEFVAICVSRLESDRLEKMKARAKDAQFLFPYLYDGSQEIGRRFGATTNASLFVLNSARRIVYMGAIDDHWKDASKVETSYARAAIDALLAGKQPEIRETRPNGCAIDYAEDRPGDQP